MWPFIQWTRLSEDALVRFFLSLSLWIFADLTAW
jgi:hypothetical protein